MEAKQNTPSTRPGTPGLDVFKIAGQSISGFLRSFKTGDHLRPRQAFTSLLEERLATYLEYHPHVRFYQRGDASEACANAYRLVTDLGTPYRINYVFDGKSHEYLPDFVGTLCDGGLLIAEAGRESEKRKGQPLAKAEAARTAAKHKGGIYIIGTEENLSERRHQNLLRLHAHRQGFPTYDEIAAFILKQWPWGELRSAGEFMQRFGSRWSEPEVEAAVWKLVGDAAAAGRLLVDLTEIELSRSTPLALLGPNSPPILPDPLPSDLMESDQDTHADEMEDEQSEDGPVELSSGLVPGPTIDASALKKPEQQARFHRNLAAVTEVLAGGTLEQVAQTHGMAIFPLWRLVQRTKELGQIACVPRATYHRDRALRVEFQELIRKLYTQPLRPTIMAVYEDVRLQQLAIKLSEQEGEVVLGPTYKQVWSFIQAISDEQQVSEARSGLKHPPRERMSPRSFVLSILYPGHICQVDEHTLDLKVVTLDGIVITRRIHGAVLICVKTAAILGAILSLDSLTEEDYMRLVKQSLEPKDRLTALYECKHPWPCFAKPAVIFHDRGKIFTSERARQVLVDRLGITTEQAPPYAPSAKGTVEALFTWVTRKFTHRMPGTTKSTPQDRGTYDSEREAQKAGITLDVLEKWFVQAIVDGYLQEWDKTRRQKRILLWEESVREKGVPRFMGSQDDLKLLLMKAVNKKNTQTGRYAIRHGALSFQGRSYVSPGLLDRLRGKEVDIFFDRRDISVIYLFLEGELVGEAYCTEFMGRRMSIWEAKAQRRSDAKHAEEAGMISRENRQQIQQEATSGRKQLSLETKRLERQRHLDQQRQDIHPEHVQVVLQALAQQQQQSPSPRSELKSSGLLPPAIPQDDPQGTKVTHLPIRSREARHD